MEGFASRSSAIEGQGRWGLWISRILQSEWLHEECLFAGSLQGFLTERIVDAHTILILPDPNV